MDKKKVAAYAAAILAILGAVGTGVKGLSTSDNLVERVRAVEVQVIEKDEHQKETLREIRRDIRAMNEKLDRLMEKR